MVRHSGPVGNDIIKLWLRSGDHTLDAKLFVEKILYATGYQVVKMTYVPHKLLLSGAKPKDLAALDVKTVGALMQQGGLRGRGLAVLEMYRECPKTGASHG